jgi:hypothetical protein
MGVPLGRLRGRQEVEEGLQGRRRNTLGALWGFRLLPCIAFVLIAFNPIGRRNSIRRSFIYRPRTVASRPRQFA